MGTRKNTFNSTVAKAYKRLALQIIKEAVKDKDLQFFEKSFMFELCCSIAEVPKEKILESKTLQKIRLHENRKRWKGVLLHS